MTSSHPYTADHHHTITNLYTTIKPSHHHIPIQQITITNLYTTIKP